MRILLLSLLAILSFTACKVVPTEEASEVTSHNEEVVSSVQGTQVSHAEWIDLHNGRFPNELCDIDFPAGMSEDMKLISYDLGENQTLFKILCSVHAYQNNFVMYTVRTDLPEDIPFQPIGLRFDTFVDGERMGQQWIIDPEFDAQALTITSRVRARGVGDCGTIATYEWRDVMGGFFDLLEFREKAECDGDIESEWPVIYERGEPGAPEGQQ